MSTARIWQLAARKMTHDATLEELQELEQLLKEEPGLALEIELHNRYFDYREPPGPEVSEAAWMRQLGRMEREFPEDFTENARAMQPVKRRKTRLWLTAAALAGLIIAIGFWRGTDTGSVPPATQLFALAKKYEIVLPDGTKAILNKNTHLYLSEGFGKTNRNVTLDGEAFFDVSHNKAIPFFVNAATVRIRVVGTVFNVRAYPDEANVQAALLRGVIEITDTTQQDLKIIMNPNEKITIGRYKKKNGDSLRPGPQQKDYFYRMDALKDVAQGLVPETAWTEGKLVFESETLAEVAVKLEKWYNVTIRIKGTRLAGEKFNGVFENVGLEQALRALQATFPFQYEMSGSVIVISEK